MSASEDYQAELRRIMDEHDKADGAARAEAARAMRVAIYHRVGREPEADLGPQRQADAPWDYVEKAGYEVTAVDGADLGRDPREMLGES